MLINYDTINIYIRGEVLVETYCVDKLDGYTSPLRYRMIDKYQRKYKELTPKLKHSIYHAKYSLEAENSHR